MWRIFHFNVNFYPDEIDEKKVRNQNLTKTEYFKNTGAGIGVYRKH